MQAKHVIRRWWFWALSIVVLTACLTLAVSIHTARADEAELKVQLSLARAEGIPTNAAEFEAMIPQAASAENAALLYERLHGKVSWKETVQIAADNDLLFSTTPKNIAAAEALLGSRREALALVDQAVRLPKCRFDRDWSQGYAVRLPEYSEMKKAATLVLLRGSVAAVHGDPNGAIRNCQELFAVANHLRQEPMLIAHLAADSIDGMAVRHLAILAFLNRHEAPYAAALKRAVEGLPVPNLEQEHLADLSSMLTTLQICSTPEGFAKFGLQKGDVSAMEPIAPFIHNRRRATLRIVRAERAYWRALRLPDAERKWELAKCTDDINQALIAWPTCASYHNMFANDSNGGVTNRLRHWEAQHQESIALVRALSTDEIPHSIETQDLKSPYDGKPLSYRFDGKQIVIKVSGYGDGTYKSRLTIPPS